eukprot:scaffold218220_cov32-Tisochrysis_lutea.AAC.3
MGWPRQARAGEWAEPVSERVGQWGSLLLKSKKPPYSPMGGLVIRAPPCGPMGEPSKYKLLPQERAERAWRRGWA